MGLFYFQELFGFVELCSYIFQEQFDDIEKQYILLEAF